MKAEESRNRICWSRNERPIIYQTFPRILTNTNPICVPNGTLQQNGSGKLSDYSYKLLKSLKKLGINTLWLTGVIENATKTDFSEYGIIKDNPNVVKGEAGSPYAIKDYYDVNPCLADIIPERMKEFEECVKRIHKEGMKVLIDFVPNHTARFYHSDNSPEGVSDFGSNDNKEMFFSPDNNYYYITHQQFSPDFNLSEEGERAYIEFPAKATGNDCFSAFCGRNDWYETVKLNYGHDYGDHSNHFNPIPDTWKKMLDILKFWASKGVDGFRCDMVFMVPLEFWHWVIPQIKNEYPDLIFIGEIYDIGLYRPFLDYGSFDYLYDKVNLYDTLVGIARYGTSAAKLTDCWQTVDGIGSRMLNFLENHDEVRFASKEFAGSPAKTLPFLVVSSLISSGPYMIYYGQELGEPAIENEGFAGFNNRSTIFDYWSYETCRRWFDSGKCDESKLNKHEKWLRRIYSKVLSACNEIPAFREGGFFDLMYVNLQNEFFNPHSLFAFLRYDSEDVYLIVANFSEETQNIKINIPEHAINISGLPEGELKAKDLLTEETEGLLISHSLPTQLSIDGYGAKILKIKKK
ncbi:MAG: alpha-amylase [Muribaculaceae bacterium]|nr:alpha-amylase [Muribaculaceae bacterium]